MDTHYKYEYFIIYNYDGDETDLSLKFSRVLWQKLSDRHISGFFSDEDLMPGRDIFEVLDTASNSRHIILVITPGFLQNQWSRYVEKSALVSVIKEGQLNRFIPVSLNTGKTEIPKELDSRSVLHFTSDWENDESGWDKLMQVLQPTVTSKHSEQRYTPAAEDEGIVDELLLNEISKHIGDTWQELLRGLGISQATIDGLEGTKNDKTFKGLKQWANNEQENAKRSVLKNVLIPYVLNKDLKKIFDYKSSNKQTPNPH